MLKRILSRISARGTIDPHAYQLLPNGGVHNVRDVLATRCLFLVTPGRSGTKSLVDFCKRNTEMYCVHSPKPWVASLGYLFHQGMISADVAKHCHYATREPYLLYAAQRGKVFFDGDCKNLPMMECVADFLPESKFIHVVRRPEAFIRSGLSRGYYRTTPHELWGHLTEGSYEMNPSVSSEEQIRRIAYFWNEANRIAESMKNSLGSARIITITAEDMFARPASIADVLSQLGLAEELSTTARLSIRKLNVGATADYQDSMTTDLVRRAVEDICETRALYYD